MYCRTITFTLLAPSIWPLIEAVAKTSDQGDYNRYLMRAINNSGVVLETFQARPGLHSGTVLFVRRRTCG